MSKLVFADDKGKKHDLKLSVIPEDSLKKGDMVLVRYDVGKASPEEVTIALAQLKTMMTQFLPEGVKPLILADREGVNSVKIEIIKDKTKQKKLKKEETHGKS